jgi:hypothetical protein
MSDTLTNPLTGLPIEDSSIESLAALVNEQVTIEDEVEALEAQLKNKKDRLNFLSEALIPGKLDELGMMSLRLANGFKVDIKPYYSCRVTGEEAYTWLDENNHGGLIKTKVVREFSRTERDAALKFVTEHPDFNLEQGVHWQTLTAFAKEIYTNGGSLPPEYFKTFEGKKTKITRK